MTLAYALLAGSDIDDPIFPNGDSDVSRPVDARADGARAHSLEASEYTSLVSRIVRGDEQAFETLYHMMWAPLVNFAHSFVHNADIAQEIVGDVFANLWQRRAEWRPLTVQSYLFGAVRNRARNHRRSQVRAEAAMTLATQDDRLSGALSGAPDAELLASERYQALQRALAALPESQHTLLVLRWQRQMRWEEIAKVLGISVAAAQQQHSRILKALRAVVEAMLA